MAITEKQAARRMNKLGASDAAAVLGLNEFQSPYDIWAQKKGIVPPFEGNTATKIGNAVESGIVSLVEEETGLKFHRNQYRAAKNGIMAANTDALCLDENIPLEIKTTARAEEWGEEDLGADGVPMRALVQLYCQMICCEATEGIIAVMLAGFRMDLRIYRIERHEKHCKAIEAELVDWWKTHIEGDTPPEGTMPETVYRAIDRPQGKAVELDTSLVERWREAEDVAKAAEREAKTLKDEVIASLGDAEIGSTPIGLVTFKAQTTRRFDQTAFKAAHPDQYAAFIKETESRVCRFKAAKNGGAA